MRARIGVLPPLDFIEADDVRRRPLRVAVTPLPSLFVALGDAIGHGRNGTPHAWRDAIRVHLKAQDRDTLAPLLTRGRTLVPDSLVGCAADVPGESFRDGIERIVATPANVLLAELEVCAAAPEGGGWRRVERDPGRWLRRYVASLLRAWRGFGPIWQRGRSSLDREVERIGLASATDAQLELLDTLSPVAGVVDGRWCIECGFATGKKELPDDGLVLVPLVSGPRGLLLDCTPTTIARLGYPAPGAGQASVHEPPVAALEALLGIPRAQILRATGRPTSIGRLAEALYAVPSAATHHVGALEAAGLVIRVRRGRHVVVERTARGEALLDLYDDVRRRGRLRLASAEAAS